MRTDALYKRAHNDLLDHVGEQGVGATLGAERGLAARLDVSRTTLRKCVSGMRDAGILSDARVVLRLPLPADRFAEAETTDIAHLVEHAFLRWILQSDSRPGQLINASRLARDFGTSTTAIREFLRGFQHFGLLEHRPNSSWVFNGMTSEFANELSDIREIFELRSVLRFARLPAEMDCWRELRELRREHVALLAVIETDFHSFSALDERLHRLINGASSNRFVMEFYHVISLIFFYHYQWNKRDERERNEAAIHQHLAYIDAIMSRDEARITQECNRHLASARHTLMRSIDGQAAQGIFKESR